MARRSVHDEQPAPRRRTPARTPEEQETVLISKSLKLIERQIDDGTASSQILSQYAKLGSSRERLEQERIMNENAVLRKKIETMEAAIDIKQLMETALLEFRGYSGEVNEDEEIEHDDFY
jgi:hypothetical protein